MTFSESLKYMSATTMLSIDQLIAIASDIRIDSAAFLTARGIEDAILPLNPIYVEAWIMELFTKKQLPVCINLPENRGFAKLLERTRRV